ncbi:hypothetical protein CN993_00725 [Bacillus thuringiensis]|nr:hypothetical protein CN993_00725 [Bacillus thuringiensis]
MAKRQVDFERVKTILLFVSVIILMAWFIHTVWDDLSHKDDETMRQEQEHEARRLQHMEMIKNIK